MTETPTEAEVLRFDLYTIRRNQHGGANLYLMLDNVSFALAVIVTGEDRDVFATQMIDKGWVGTVPSWQGHIPVVIVPHGDLIDVEKLRYVVERM